MEKEFDLMKDAKNLYVLRSTNEEVEVTSFNQVSKGERSEEDWVTYIDKDGVEHIKEHLNMELDFKASDLMLKFLGEMFKAPTFESKPIKLPDISVGRAFEVAKSLYVNGASVNDAIDEAERFMDKFNQMFKEESRETKED